MLLQLDSATQSAVDIEHSSISVIQTSQHKRMLNIKTTQAVAYKSSDSTAIWPIYEPRIRKLVYRQATLASGIGRIPFVSIDTITPIRTIRVTAVGQRYTIGC